MSERTKFAILLCLLIVSVALALVLNSSYNQALLGH